ncbi:SPOR domain-containing protein [Alphaproteobacteria bacterium LSUCC0719]
MARNPAGKSGGIWLKTLLFGVLAIGGIGAAAIILQPMLVTPASDVVLIKAEPGPFREKPVSPGGAKIPHTDSTVMGMLGGMVEKQEDVEILQPPADVPEMPPLPKAADETIVMAPEPAPVVPADGQAPKVQTPDANTSDGPVDLAKIASATDQTATPSETGDSDAGAAGKTDGKTEGETGPADRPGDADQTETQIAGAQGSETDSASSDTASLQSMPKSKPAESKRPKGPAVEGDEPLYLVQLAAFRNAATAREQAAMLGGKHQSRLSGVELGTMKVDAGENGIFWRVITEPLQRVDADNLCSALKRAGQDCILRKFDNQSSS